MRTSLTRTKPSLPSAVVTLNHRPCWPATCNSALRSSVATAGEPKSGAACTSTLALCTSAAIVSASAGMASSARAQAGARTRWRRREACGFGFILRAPGAVRTSCRKRRVGRWEAMRPPFILVSVFLVAGKRIVVGQRSLGDRRRRQQAAEHAAHAGAGVGQGFVLADGFADQAGHAHAAVVGEDVVVAGQVLAQRAQFDLRAFGDVGLVLAAPDQHVDVEQGFVEPVLVL